LVAAFNPGRSHRLKKVFVNVAVVCRIDKSQKLNLIGTWEARAERG
jgi:hypothetical protein